MESLRIENVVGSTAINQGIDLENLAEDLEGVSFDPDIFPGLVYRLEDPKASCLIFRSGKVVCTGAESIADLERAANHTLDVFRELGLDVPEAPDITIQNIVTSGDLGEQLNLNAIAIGLGLENVEYEPEQFPGLVYRLQEHDVVALLFGSGKLVITGGTRLEDIEDGLAAIQSKLADLQLIQGEP